MSISRREALGTLASAAAVAVAGAVSGQASTSSATPALPSTPEPPSIVPLHFDPKSLRGISEKLITSHWENNYGGAVKNLAKVRDAIAQTGKDTPAFLVSGLRERELSFHNSVVLHEHYFANLGGSGKVDGPVTEGAADTFGSLGRFEELLRATAMGLAGGSGWALLAYDLNAAQLRVSWSANHTQTLAFARPLLVIDMYEHAYQMDYGAAAAKYVDAFFGNVSWEEVNRRYEGALRTAKALKE